VALETPHFQAYRGEQPPRFVNEAELEYAKILDYYGVPWMYEPHTFVLERDDEGKVVEAFTPDFYLPEQDLYLEVTVMKQSLGDAQEPQAAEAQQRYPDVRIKLFYERDFERHRVALRLCRKRLLTALDPRIGDELPRRRRGRWRRACASSGARDRQPTTSRARRC
jgi:hypothetical protein